MSPQAYKHREVRKQRRLLRMGTNHPFCPGCGWRDWRSFEGHHIAGESYSKKVVVFVCRNCHGLLSDMQKDQPDQITDPPSEAECQAHALLGIADMLRLRAARAGTRRLAQLYRQFADECEKSARVLLRSCTDAVVAVSQHADHG
jgi:hypothetical protein